MMVFAEGSTHKLLVCAPQVLAKAGTKKLETLDFVNQPIHDASFFSD